VGNMDYRQWAAEGAKALSRFRDSGDSADLDRAVALLHKAAMTVPENDPGCRDIWGLLGEALGRRYRLGGQIGDLDGSIYACRKAAGLSSRADQGWTSLMFSMGISLITRYELTGDIADLDGAIEASREGIATAPDGYPALFARRTDLAGMLYTRFTTRQALADLDEALALCQEALIGVPAGDPTAGEVVDALSRVARFRYFAVRSPQALEDWIAALHQAGRHPAAAAASESITQWLGGAYGIRFEETGSVDDLDSAAADVMVHAIVALPDNGWARVPNLPDLPSALMRRYGVTGDEGYLTAARDAVGLELRAASASGSEARVSRAWSVLGGILMDSHTRTGRRDVLDEGIAAHQRGLQSALESEAQAGGSFYRALAGVGLADALQTRYSVAGDPADVDSAIALCREAMSAWPPEAGDSDVPTMVLGTLLLDRFYLHGKRADIEESISLHRQAVRANPSATALKNLAIALAAHCRATGCADDIEEMASAAERAVTLAREYPLHSRVAYEQALGNVMECLFECRGEGKDLDRAISIRRGIVEPGDRADPLWARHAGELAGALWSRFARFGRAADLNEAIRLTEEALACPGERAEDRPRHLNLLAIALDHRFGRDEDAADLDYAAQSLTKALGMVPDDGLLWATMQSHLGIALRKRYQRSSDLSDLDAAVDAHRRACRALPGARAASATVPPGPLVNLAMSLGTRFRARGDLRDIKEAVAAAQAAADSIGEGHADYANVLGALAMCLEARYDATGDPRDLQAALDRYQSAAASVASPVAQRVSSARQGGDLAARSQRTDLALSLYGTAIRLLQQLAWRGLDRDDQERQLTGIATAAGLAREAAAVAVAAGRPDVAVEFLEHGRAVLWEAIADMRGDLSELVTVMPSLATRMKEVRSALDGVDGPRADGVSHGPDRMALAREWDELVAQARRIDGFEDFQKVPSAGALLRAASQGPVVIINVAATRCDALVIQATGITAVPLPRLSETAAVDRTALFLGAMTVRDQTPDMAWADAKRILEDSERVLDETARWLWDVTIGPVIDHLGVTDNAQTGHGQVQLPRVWWCPTGPLTFLPVHAAGYHDGSGHSVIDRTISSYTPTLRSLIRSREQNGALPLGAVTRDQLLLVSLAETQGEGSLGLPGVQREREVIGQLVRTDEGQGEVIIVSDSDATVAAVREHIRRHPRVHFACHGMQDLMDPSAGGIRLHDGMLTIREIAGLHMPGAEFACIAACQTATGGARLQDECVSFASALHAAGYQHVIATLWSVSDRAAVNVMKFLYANLTAHGRLEPGHSASALRDGLLRVRNAAPGAPSWWMMYTHTGP
jgi:tetratricopeptide (TPR) repeat protein